jgi:fucose permease
VPPLLADLHSHWRGQAFAEANVAACVGGLLAPLCVSSLLVHLDWRGVAAVGWLGALLLWWPLKRIALPAPLEHPHDHVHHLPWRFWGFWTLLVLSVSAEFSFNVWGASFFEGVVGMPKAQAVFAFTAFPVGMLLGRFSGALFYRQLGEARLILASLLLALLGFVLFWGQAHPLGCALGLFLAGLGVANQYPMMFSSAVATAPQSSELAAARVSMGSGLAIIVAPLVLGMLADGIGMRLGYLIVPLMLLTALLLWWRLQVPALKAQSC